MKLTKSQLNALSQNIYMKLREKKEREYKKKVEEYVFNADRERKIKDLLDAIAAFNVVFPNVLSSYYRTLNNFTYDILKKEIIERMELIPNPTYKTQSQIENDILLKTIEPDFNVNEFIEEYVKLNG